MLPKRLRIQKKDFPSPSERSKTFAGQYFSLRISRKNKTGGVSVVVSGKVSKKAVVRNKIKRIVYGALESYKKTALLKNHHLIFYARKECASTQNKNLHEDIVGLIKKTTLV